MIKWQVNLLWSPFLRTSRVPLSRVYSLPQYKGCLRPLRRGKVNRMKEESWKSKEYSFFCHKKCEYFPCHKTDDPDNFNCLFCYCPLYALGDRCGGNFRYTESGTKDCTHCTIPHRRENYGYIIGRYAEIMELARREKE